MLFKVKSLNLSTGRPVAILNEDTAKKLAVFVGERVRIRKIHSIVAVLNVSKNIIHENQAGELPGGALWEHHIMAIFEYFDLY